ncbi:MAG: methyltransferase domain-containing protein [Rhodospirillales bacterium]|nr:methyltransferase domain-containing protein [Rhodospirillales bacterium]
MFLVKLNFSNTKLDLRRSIFGYSKVQRIVSALIRNRIVFANRKKKGCYLDLGCGQNVSPDFCNLDYGWHPGTDICWDVTRGLPFPEGYVSGIFSEHMLEHIPFADALKLLAECRRILRKGGTLRLVVPDGELYLSQYCKHQGGNRACMPNADSDKTYFAIVTPIVSVNRIFRFYGHQFIWDYETLRLALYRAGFENVEKRTFGEGADVQLLRDTPSRSVESLYVEAS